MIQAAYAKMTGRLEMRRTRLEISAEGSRAQLVALHKHAYSLPARGFSEAHFSGIPFSLRVCPGQTQT